jgi:hypothetical protein
MGSGNWSGVHVFEEEEPVRYGSSCRYNYEEVWRMDKKDFIKVTCGACSGRGMEIASDANSPSGKTVHNPCRCCNGYGYYRSYGGSNHTLTENEFLNLP